MSARVKLKKNRSVFETDPNLNILTKVVRAQGIVKINLDFGISRLLFITWCHLPQFNKIRLNTTSNVGLLHILTSIKLRIHSSGHNDFNFKLFYTNLYMCTNLMSISDVTNFQTDLYYG